MPYELYIDESGTLADEIFVIAGLAIRDEEWSESVSRWCEILRRAGWSSTEEVYWHAMARRGSGDRERHTRLLDALFGLLGALPLTCIAIVIDTVAGRRERRDLFGSRTSAPTTS